MQRIIRDLGLCGRPNRTKSSTTAESLESEFDNWGLKTPGTATVPGDWKILSDELESILLAKSEDKSEFHVNQKGTEWHIGLGSNPQLVHGDIGTRDQSENGMGDEPTPVED